MARKSSFIKLDRSILNWGWYKDINTKVLFFHLLLKANWQAGTWQGHDFEKGDIITSINTLSEETGLTIQNVKTAIKHLILTKEVTSKNCGKFRIISVVNYSVYQGANKVANHGLTTDQQSANHGLTTVKEYKEYKEVKKRENNARPTLEEVVDFFNSEKIKIDPKRFFYYYEAKDWEGVTNWQAKAMEWSLREKERPGYVEEPTRSYDLAFFDEYLLRDD